MTDPNVLEAIYRYGNLVEAIAWFAFSIRFLIKSRRTTTRRVQDQPTLGRLTALTFLLFGGSDLVEIQTLAWWRPWWLLLWKAGCTVTLLVLFLLNRFTRASDR